MIYKNLFISFIFLYLIPNFVTAKRLTKDINLSFESTLTEVDDDIARIHDAFRGPTKLTYRRDTTKGTHNGVVVQNSAKFKILNHPTSTNIVKFPNNNDYKPVLFANPRWDKSPKKDPCSEKGRTYCENPPDYPAEEIQKLLEKTKINIPTLNVDLSFLNNTTPTIDLANRIDTRNQQVLCHSDTVPKSPKKAETEEGEWLFLVPNQVVMVDECVSPGTPCEVLQNLQTKCEQKYLLRKLYAFDILEGKKEIREVEFKIPSCCMCTVTNTPGLSMARRRRRHSKTSLQRSLHAASERDKRNAKTYSGVNPDFAYPDQIASLTESPALSSRINNNNITCSGEFGTLCEKVKNYPKDLIANLRKRGAFRNSPLFGQDKIGVELTTRADSNTSPMCGATTRTVFPQAAKTIKNEVKLVAQDEEGGFVQGIIVEECAIVDTTCNFQNYFPAGYVTKCQQMYIYRQLEMIDTQSGKSAPDFTSIPSCCACHVVREPSMATK